MIGVPEGKRRKASAPPSLSCSSRHMVGAVKNQERRRLVDANQICTPPAVYIRNNHATRQNAFFGLNPATTLGYISYVQGEACQRILVKRQCRPHAAALSQSILWLYRSADDLNVGLPFPYSYMLAFVAKSRVSQFSTDEDRGHLL